MKKYLNITFCLLLFSSFVRASDFITEWDLSTQGSGFMQLSFEVETSGPVNYTWESIPAGFSGSGTFTGSTTVTLTGFSGSADIRLKINPLNFQRIKMENSLDKLRLEKLTQWGTVAWTSMASAFKNCSNCDFIATDIPDLSSVTDMSSMFYNCDDLYALNNLNNWNTSNVTNMEMMFMLTQNFNLPIGNWNTGNVINMSGMFAGAGSFNQPIGNWNTSNVEDMSDMFNYAGDFNQPIGNWNTGNVKDMSNMFYFAYFFNKPLSNWNTSNVTNMRGMFAKAEDFNQPIGNWNTSNVTDMSYMFEETDWFNQAIGNWNTSNVTNMQGMFKNSFFNENIGNWDVSNVTNMSEMFFSADNFNKPLANWDVSNVTNMKDMFNQANLFNQPIGNWNVSSVQTMTGMFFNADNFNQPLANWDVSQVTSMENMFSNANTFNQPIGNWNVSNVKNMFGMFNYTFNFNQPLGNWDVNNVTNMSGMFSQAFSFNQPLGNWQLNASDTLGNMLTNCGLDCINYSSTLIDWSANINIPSNKYLGAQSIQYGTTAVSARNYLISAKGWTINGDIASNYACCLNPITSTQNQSVCNSFYFNGQNLLTSGIYLDTIANPIGCDSFITLNLTVQKDSANQIQITCAPYTFNGQNLTTSGIYFDTLINVHGCDSIIRLDLTITSPNTTVTAIGNDLIATATNVTYQWLTCPTYTPISGATGKTYSATSNGSYAVVINENGCIDTSVCVLINAPNANEIIPSFEQLALYPNPASTEVILKLPSSIFEIERINIVNCVGQSMKVNLLNQSPNEKKLDVSHFSKGWYQVVVYTNEHTFHQKLFIK